MANRMNALRHVLASRQQRRNTRVLLGFILFAIAVIILDTILFEFLMWQFEDQSHTWITALYWVLTTMTTLGLGDIVFVSDIGRLFTSFVLMSGIVLFLIVLPFSFIRYFYAPWVETARVPARMTGHVIITTFDNIALPLIQKLELHRIPYYVIEPDPVQASSLHGEGVSAVTGAIDDRVTYEKLRVASARLVVANAADAVNTNVTLTVREVAPIVPIAATADSETAIEILRLAGVTQVLPIKQRLGERLASRLNAGHAQAHVIGTLRDLFVAEFPVHNTPFVGSSIRETRLRETLGINIVGVLEQAGFVPARPETVLTEHSVPVIVGSREQIQALDEFLVIYDANYSPALVIGGGAVGRAAVRILKQKGIPVYLVDKLDVRHHWDGNTPDRVFVGDAAAGSLLIEAGLKETPGVLLTTNDDAMNIYLALQCRRLAPEVRIVSRITHDHNLTAIRRAGADIALSHTSLAVESIFAALRGHELVVLGEGVELHEVELPGTLEGKTLAEANIAARTGLNVVAIQDAQRLLANPPAATVLAPGSSLLMIGAREQLNAFSRSFA